jgi:hypothetical protein
MRNAISLTVPPDQTADIMHIRSITVREIRETGKNAGAIRGNNLPGSGIIP